MKRYLFPAFLLGIFLVAARFWSEYGVHAAGSGGACAGNGDVNGDGTRDISDAVSLLSWLFTGGKPPVACGDGASGWTISGNNMYADVSGNVGIGSTSPGKKLQMGNNTVANAEGMIRLASHSGTNGSNRTWDIGVPETDADSSGIGYSFNINDIDNGEDPELMVKWGTGYVGIGTTAPDSQLHVVKPDGSTAQGVLHLETISKIDTHFIKSELIFNGTSINSEGTLASPAIHLNSTSEGNVLMVNGGGKVGIGTNSPKARLDVAGTARMQIAEIAGADLAERFPVNGALEPGMVASIDPKDPGALTLCREPYSRRVAGVVSGANKLPTGAILGNLPEDRKTAPVALSGRVWVWSDASDAPIEPGDLLTTSAVPGHAMKVADHARAQGAILGKAMTALAEGRGMVLVLVTLQ